MASGTSKSVATIATIAVLVPILVGMWFAAPFFLPMYRWLHINLGQISRTSGIPEKSLATEYTMRVRYNPRGEGDPIPWQIIDSTPAYDTVYPGPDNDESHVLVRCTMLSGNDGKPPSTTFINGTYQDRYFTLAKALRLPGGSIPGSNPKRPVVVYSPIDMKKMSINEAYNSRGEASGFENDDLWKERDDGWEAPNQP